MGRLCPPSDNHLRCDSNGVLGLYCAAIFNNVRGLIYPKVPRLVPFIEGGKTYVPVNFVASSLGATVSYNAKTKVVTITLKEG